MRTKEIKTKHFALVGRIKKILPKDMFTSDRPPSYITHVVIDDQNQDSLEINTNSEVAEALFGLTAADLAKVQKHRYSSFHKILMNVIESNQLIKFGLETYINWWTMPEPETHFLCHSLEVADDDKQESKIMIQQSEYMSIDDPQAND